VTALLTYFQMPAMALNLPAPSTTTVERKRGPLEAGVEWLVADRRRVEDDLRHERDGRVKADAELLKTRTDLDHARKVLDDYRARPWWRRVFS
jgi:hypothetical protein